MLISNTFAFTHRFLAFNHNRIGIVNYAVTDRVGENRFADFVTPCGYVKLRTEDS